MSSFISSDVTVEWTIAYMLHFINFCVWTTPFAVIRLSTMIILYIRFEEKEWWYWKELEKEKEMIDNSRRDFEEKICEYCYHTLEKVISYTNTFSNVIIIWSYMSLPSATASPGIDSALTGVPDPGEQSTTFWWENLQILLAHMKNDIIHNVHYILFIEIKSHHSLI